MTDTLSIINAAVADAGLSDASDAPEPLVAMPDESVADPAVEGDDLPAAVEGDEPVAEPAKEPAKDAAGLDAEAIKLLEAAGIKASKPGERDNKIPHSRTVKIIGNALKKQAATHQTALADATTKLTAAETRAKTYEAADKLADSDPDRYMQILATVNPAFKKYVDAAAGGVKEPVKVAEPVGEKAPAPDVKFEDGSLGYSPEQAQKREDWLIATAEKRAYDRVTKEFEKRLSPFEKREAAAQAQAARLPGIQQAITEQKEVWGDLYPKDGSPEQLAASKLLHENPKMSLATALQKVLLPKVRQSRETQRAELLKELEKRPAAAAAKKAAQTKVADSDPSKVRDTEDVIREAIAAAGLT